MGEAGLDGTLAGSQCGEIAGTGEVDLVGIAGVDHDRRGLAGREAEIDQDTSALIHEGNGGRLLGSRPGNDSLPAPAEDDALGRGACGQDGAASGE